MRLGARIGMAVIVPTLAVCGLFAPRLHHPDTVAVHTVTAPHRVVPGAGRHALSSAPTRPPADTGAIPVDLYGNEVTDAVAEYKLDSDGSLYEMHSPQTELPRLGSPKS